MDFQNILAEQRDFFNTQKTKNLKFRKMYLEKLKEVLLKNEELLCDSIYKDFGKSKFDTYTTEISFVIKDIDYFLNNLKSLAKRKSVRTNLANQFGSSKIYSEPLGCTLVIGAWNYPLQLSLSPMVAALAAGNTCIVKPSEIAENCMKAMAKIINENFPKEYLFVAEGGVEETTEILKLKFDKIFFTGSPKVGKIIYEAAAKHLTPVVLELGGKSPAIVTSSANFEVAAKRIVWGKFLNAGQTCVAPDYILVDEKVKDSFLDSLKSYIQKFNYQADSKEYTQIINDRNFERLTKLIDQDKVFFGGETDAAKRFIEPTILQNVTWNDAVMQEEIFGPILPVLTFKNFNEALIQIAAQEKPLSAYLFTASSEEKENFVSKISFGGGCINDVVMHLSNDYLPFGGVGNSGIGNYHGKFGFDAFSHQKSILDRATWAEPDFKYPPYTDKKLNWIKKLL
ncbi:aldehyde dehydrogenase [Kaistella jeonii]|uniref:Aldehyde dehydrogenase n=1 Tax=Kaistella jeonii TaxID=266749 RepID=A0A0C1CVE5_9FLAO|nr:aldehyde dehydrogenase [Kaistella jeonii]KIA88321.1 aldehyde dehydrogenase [Kaistella jeonii]SFC23923.1 aldehyde dehydrogenase (NAD+) [Kaistella jeonii]VEI94583.1 Coniferyl aldehyde dehydrogenase [Kaistella jeonii]